MRFIPTGVGNICRSLVIILLSPVHPHGCGEHVNKTYQSIYTFGSSPRVWGTSPQPLSQRIPCRFIPTGVGNIHSPRHPVCLPSVHPHGCGEHIRCSISNNLSIGSSPRVWGTLVVVFRDSTLRRFIPTGVGNIVAGHNLHNQTAVHPHGCGEHFSFELNDALVVGSSPRVWGTFKPDDIFRGRSRFIPTGVGNIWKNSRKRSRTSVHPHGCGEHIVNKEKNAFIIGSSPRVWGT